MTTPYRFQIKGVRKITRLNGRVLLADSMGLGKTLQILLYAQQNPTVRPIVVVCPASIKYNWGREAMKHIGMRASVLEGTKVPEDQLIPELAAELIILNYDILKYWVPTLKKIKPQLIVGDEAHALIDPRSQRTRALRELCKNVPHVILATGTPFQSRPAQIWPMLNIIRPDLYPSFRPFGERYCRPKLTPWGWKYDGAERLDELNKILLREVMVRRLKEDVLQDLPDKARHVTLLDLPNRAEYDRALNDFASWVRDQPNIRADRALRAQAVTKITYLKKLVGELKVPSIVAWIEQFLNETGEKLLVFGIHTELVEGLRERFDGQAVMVNGSITKRKRQQAFDQFNKDKRTRLFIGNIDAAGVGWNCTSASTTAHVELAWVPAKHSQAEDRVHGMSRGMENVRSRAYYLIAADTLEEKLLTLLQARQKTMDAAIDGNAEASGYNVKDLLIEAIRNDTKR